VSQIEYNPFKEDVYSLGLTILQLCLLCEDRDLLEMGSNLRLQVDAMSYSSSIKCLVLLALREDSKQRPDFLQLEGIFNDLLRQKDCDRLYVELIDEIVVPLEEEEVAGCENRKEVSRSSI